MILAGLLMPIQWTDCGPLESDAIRGDENEDNLIRARGFDYRVDIGSSIADLNSVGVEDYANPSQCQKRSATGYRC